MAIKRAGAPEAPDQIVSITNPGNPVGNTAVMWQALGETAQKIGQKVQPSLNALAEQRAGQDAANGNYHRRAVINAEDEYYNNAMEQLYAVKASTDIDTMMDGLENNFPADGDVRDFDSQVNAARSGFISSSVPAFAPQAGALFDRAHLAARQRIGTRQRNLAVEALQQNGQARLTQMEDQLSGFTDLTSPEYQSRWQEYDSTGAALAANPLSGMHADEWTLRRDNTLGRLQGNAMQYTAERIYEDGGSNAESAEQAMALLERGMNDPSLTLNEAQRDAFFGEGRRRIQEHERTRLAGIREARAEMRAMRGDARDDARDTLAEFAARAEAFTVIPDTELQTLRDTVQASGSASLARQYNELALENNYRQQVHGASLTQVEILNDQLQAEVTANGPRAGDAAIQLRAGRAYAEHMRRGDPLVVAQQHFGEAPPPLFSDDGHFQAQNLGRRIRFAEAATNELGAATPSYFTPGEREALAGVVRGGGEPALAATRAIVSSAFSQDGDGFTRAQTMLHEVAARGDDALLAAGTTLLLGGESSAPTARFILDAQRLRQIPGHATPVLPGANQDAIRNGRIDAYVGGRDAFMSAEMRAQTRRSADLVFEGMVAGGAQPTTHTYDSAIRASLGSVMRTVNNQQHRFGGIATGRGEERVPIPNWLRNDQFATIRQSLTLGDYSRAGGSAPPRTGAVRDWNNAYLIWTGEPGRYHLAQNPDGNGWYESQPGVPYVLDFNLIRNDSRAGANDGLSTRRPDAVVR